MPLIVFTRTQSPLADELIAYCPPGSVSSIDATTLPNTVVEVTVTSEGQDDAIEFMAGKGYVVSSIV